MKKLLVLFFVLAMCWPCYGEVLVYKTIQKGTQFSFNSWVDDYGSSQELKAGGFLLLDIDIYSGRISWINSAFLIAYGEGMTSLELEDLEALYGRSGAKTYMTISSFSVFDSIYDSYDPNEYFVFGDTFVVAGVVKETSLIKGGAKVSIPAALKGSCYTDELVAKKRALCMITVSAGLDKKWTARANDLSDLGGEDALYNTFWAIHDYLVDQGYPPLSRAGE